MHITQPSSRRKAFWFPRQYTIITNQIVTIKNIEQDRGTRVANIHRKYDDEVQGETQVTKYSQGLQKGKYKYMSIKQETLVDLSIKTM